jgi:hypothetical protein
MYGEKRVKNGQKSQIPSCFNGVKRAILAVHEGSVANSDNAAQIIRKTGWHL